MKQFDQIRYSLAALLLLLVYGFNVYATNLFFKDKVLVVFFGAILAVQTLLTLVYHLRCLQSEGCMERAGQNIWLFYKVFGITSFFSILLVFLRELPLLSTGSNDLVLILLIAFYSLLLIVGVSTAISAIIGIRNATESNVSSDRKSNQQTPNTPSGKQLAEERERATYEELLRQDQELRST